MEGFYQLKLHFHIRDFQPGEQIIKNIENAVVNSNHAIIILSTGFLESERCKEELEMCLMEHKNDPSFKVFFILAQPKDYLLTFLSKKEVSTPTRPIYAELLKKIEDKSLNFDDPQLWEKLFKKIGKDSDDDTNTDNTKFYEYDAVQCEKMNAHTPLLNACFR